MSFCVIYSVVLENHSVLNFHWGEGSISSSWSIELKTECYEYRGLNMYCLISCSNITDDMWFLKHIL